MTTLGPQNIPDNFEDFKKKYGQRYNHIFSHPEEIKSFDSLSSKLESTSLSILKDVANDLQNAFQNAMNREMQPRNPSNDRNLEKIAVQGQEATTGLEQNETPDWFDFDLANFDNVNQQINNRRLDDAQEYQQNPANTNNAEKVKNNELQYLYRLTMKMAIKHAPKPKDEPEYKPVNRLVRR